MYLFLLTPQESPHILYLFNFLKHKEYILSSF